MMVANWETSTQQKNIAWFLPRPKKDRYKGGMPLHAERWCLDLARELYGDKDAEILNLFCGMNQQGFRVDINPAVNPDLVCDAHHLSEHLTQQFDVIFADPPYSDEEAKEIYGTPKLNYRKWTSEATKLLRPCGILVVYHKYVVPNPDPKVYRVVKRVFIGSRAWHLPRVAIYYQKQASE
jgi:hypothetical protein